MDQLREEFKDGYKVQRYKGLGEMDAEQLWETTMDPHHRVLKRVTIDDAMEADSVFDMLMGEDVEPRREYIQEMLYTLIWITSRRSLWKKKISDMTM